MNIFFNAAVNFCQAIRLKLIIFIAIFFITQFEAFSQSFDNKGNNCQLILLRETHKAIELKKVFIYFSASPLMVRSDSIYYDYSKIHFNEDTVFFNREWSYPVYMKLRFVFSDYARISNTFHYDDQIKKWEVSVLDSSLSVKHKPVDDNFKLRNSLNGLVLIINAACEMFIALIISRLFGWSHLLVLMVLAANIAVFPVYIFPISNLYYRELIVAIVKLLVMLAIGYRRIKYYKIVIFAIILIFIGLGIRGLLFFFSYII